MATMTMPLPLAAMRTRDDDGAPAYVTTTSPSAPRPEANALRFPAAGDAARAWIGFMLPTDFGAGPALRLAWCSSSTSPSHACVWAGLLEPSTSLPEAFAEPLAPVTVTAASTVDTGLARREVVLELPLPADERFAPGLSVAVLIARDGESPQDTLTGAADLLSAALVYTAAE